jgi:hypothetical protein
MARTVNEINNAIVASYVSYMAAVSITIDPTQWSRRNLQRAIIYVVASAIAIFEQIQDLYYAKQEALIETSPAGSKAWLQAMIFKFQYDSVTPQVIQLDISNLSYYYPIVNDDLRIVTRCAIISTLENQVFVKVAKNEPPQALSGAEVSALQDYVSTIGVAGVTYTVTSADADRLYLGLDLYYQGQYSTVILDNVVAAIETYLSGIPFNGVMRLTDLEIAIKQVAGVNDVVLKNIKARADATPFANATLLVSNGTELIRQWPTYAGYMLPEDTVGQTPTDSINLIAE